MTERLNECECEDPRVREAVLTADPVLVCIVRHLGLAAHWLKEFRKHKSDSWERAAAAVAFDQAVAMVEKMKIRRV